MTIPYVIQVISAGRPHRVQPMQEIVGLPMLWYVPGREVDDYRSAGAEVVEAGQLSESRNQALDEAHEQGAASVQLSDDLTSIKFYTPDPEKLLPRAERFQPWSFKQALDYMLEALAEHEYNLAGVAITTNEMNYKSEFQTQHYILGDWIVVPPSTPRFDTNLRLKEDYDFTCQHLATYGGALRCCAVIANFIHRTNEGGACRYRTEEEEKKAIRYLRAKWPNAFVKHRKETELVMRWRGA